MSIFEKRKNAGAVCPKCKSPDYNYNGRANEEQDKYWEQHGKHQFECNSCGFHWQYGKNDSIFTDLKNNT